MPVAQYIVYLKEAKAEYLTQKLDQRRLRDEYVIKLAPSEIKRKRNNKKLKLHWRVLKKYFGKSKSKSILAVEYTYEGCNIRASS